MVDRLSKDTKKTFFSGVLLLTLSTVLVKLIGLFYKIPMLSYLGVEGMGYFNSAYEIYALFCVISTAGLPVALSVMISAAIAKGEKKRVAQIYRVTLIVFLVIGFLGSLVMWIFADAFCGLIQSANTRDSIRAISPTVFFVCLSSALRGYFQGYQKMLPTALSQLIESVGKLLFGLLFARLALYAGYDTATVSSFAGWGLTLGTALSALYLWVAKTRFCAASKREGRSRIASLEPSERGTILGQLARLAIPMTLGASLVSLTKLIDMTMILRRLQSIGYSEIAANEAYGSYTTLALSVFGLLPSLVNSVALPLVPMLSASIASGDREKQQKLTRASYQLISLLSLPAAFGLAAFARPILLLLFRYEPDAVNTAAPLLSYLGVSVFLSCMITATNSVLHAYRVVNRPILSMLAGALVKVLTAYLLIGSPRIAMAGAPISTFFCNATVVLLNLYFAARVCPLPSLGGLFLRPMLVSAASVGIAFGLYLPLCLRFGDSVGITLVAMLLVFVFYFILSCLFGVFCAEDLLLLPFGERILRLLKRLHLLKE